MAKAMVSFFDNFPEYNGQKIESLSYQEQKDYVLKIFAFAVRKSKDGDFCFDLVAHGAFCTRYFKPEDREIFKWIGVGALEYTQKAMERFIQAEKRHSNRLLKNE